MKNKRGTEDISLNIFFGVIAALLIVGAIVLAANKLTIKTGKFECQNINFWDGFNGLKEKLKQVDSGKHTEFLFYNKDCYLVSFSFASTTLKNNRIYTDFAKRTVAFSLYDIRNQLNQHRTQSQKYQKKRIQKG